MANPLQQTLNGLAATFVASIIESIRASSLEDVGRDAPVAAAAPASRAPRPPRATERLKPRTGPAAPSGRRSGPRNTAKDAATIVAYLRSHPGSSGEAARHALGLEKNRWNTCVYRALRDGQIKKRGDRRSTKYWAV
jgi:hypothetical protein